jgi:hypothetical protein
VSRGERIAAITGIWVVVAAVVVLNAVYPWFRYHVAGLQWALGMVAGWLLCSAVNRKPRG